MFRDAGFIGLRIQDLRALWGFRRRRGACSSSSRGASYALPELSQSMVWGLGFRV